ncbi:MAG: hypothetical protein Q9170_003999 [Blastenia crenularia]
MATILGKRKRRAHASTLSGVPDSREDPYHDDQLQSLLRQHFETKFEPLESSDRAFTRETVLFEELDANIHDTDWTGFSEEEEGGNALVVNYQIQGKHKANVSKAESKLFMGTKPPLQSLERPSPTKSKDPDPLDPEEAITDAANLKKDLALRRLLEESHLLDPASSLSPSGQKRHKALDIRQQALGSKSSVFSHKNMPIAQRKGILAKAAEKDEHRRREAKDNGIILEKASKVKARGPKRQREIGAPAVGKFTRGMLTLSKKDVSDIVGRSKQSKRR